MAYTIKNTDGTTLLLLGDGKLDTNSTSITLVGKNYSSYGEIWNNNLVKIMGNFANAEAPTSPVKGQIWYDSLNGKLNVYDEVWEPLNGAQVSVTEPTYLSNGDLWFDSVNEQLFVKLDTGTKLVGPAFPVTIGNNGWILPPVAVQDNTSGVSGNVKQVTLLRNYGQTRGYIANEKFTIATTSTYSYLTNNTTATVKGLTVFGDVRATDTLYSNTLTVTSDIVYPLSQRVGRVEELDFYVEINNLAVRVFNTGPSFRPEIRAVTGTADITFSGYIIKMGDIAPTAYTQALTTINTTPTAMVLPASEFTSVGDMLEFLLTDQTVNTEEGIKTYKISIQIATVSPTVRASIAIEKLV